MEIETERLTLAPPKPGDGTALLPIRNSSYVLERNAAPALPLEKLEQQLAALQIEEQKNKRSAEQLEKIKTALEQELSFENGINSELVTTILDHIVVKKGSTKKEVHLGIHLKFGDPYEVVFDREKMSVCFNRS